MENNLINAEYDNFIVEIKNKIRKSQYEAMKAVNTTLINLYWGIGEYEKYLINQTNFDETLPEKYVNQAKLAVKDEYIFDIMELSEQHSERELERALVDNIKDFLGEMGGNFAFMGNQYHLNVDGNDFYIDLLLYHRSLKSLVAIELKIGEFKPEYVGQLQFYLTVLDKQVKMESDNPSIGFIICKE